MAEEQVADTIASGERTDLAVNTDAGEPVPENENVTQSLFGEEVSDAELRGEEEPPPKGDEPPAPSATPQPKEEKQVVTPPVAEEPKTPPPGYVPLPALHEERGKRQALTSRVQELEAENEALKQGQKTTDQGPPASKDAKPPEDFKILTPDEFKELAESDVVEAQIYQYNLQLYKDEQAAKVAQAEGTKRAQELTSQIINRRFTEMEEAVPGIFAEDGTVNQTLTEFADSHGVEPEVLATLTDPATRIVQKDGRVVILGKGAVQVLKLINSFYQGTKPDPSKEAQMKEKVTAEVIKKIHDTSGGYRNIGETPPGGSSVPLDPNRMLSETEMAKLSPEQQERYLRGD